jgi:hypothetical protein
VLRAVPFRSWSSSLLLVVVVEVTQVTQSAGELGPVERVGAVDS